MTLVDLFEYFNICWTYDRKNKLSNEDESALWTLFKYLGVSDILNLR